VWVYGNQKQLLGALSASDKASKGFLPGKAISAILARMQCPAAEDGGNSAPREKKEKEKENENEQIKGKDRRKYNRGANETEKEFCHAMTDLIL
jgi:hypothetical protein